MLDLMGEMTLKVWLHTSLTCVGLPEVGRCARHAVAIGRGRWVDAGGAKYIKRVTQVEVRVSTFNGSVHGGRRMRVADSVRGECKRREVRCGRRQGMRTKSKSEMLEWETKQIEGLAVDSRTW